MSDDGLVVNEGGGATVEDVNQWIWQDELGYRCGDPETMWILWEQSDDSQDRVFARSLTFSVDAASGQTPSPIALGGIVELEQGSGAGEEVPTTPTGPPRSAGARHGRLSTGRSSCTSASSSRVTSARSTRGIRRARTGACSWCS